MKASFLNFDRPMITAMVNAKTPDGTIERIKVAAAEGADAVGL